MVFQNLGNFLVASFNKPEIGICISLIVSKLVLLMEFHEVVCCMACVSSIAWIGLVDGMPAVSAQCWCGHQIILFNAYLCYAL